MRLFALGDLDKHKQRKKLQRGEMKGYKRFEVYCKIEAFAFQREKKKQIWILAGISYYQDIPIFCSNAITILSVESKEKILIKNCNKLIL